MFDHVRDDWLDQRKYPWISLTQAAVYLVSPDDNGRLAAIRSHEWQKPFERLLEWIQGGEITVYEAWYDGPYQPIPKEDFFGVLVKYPSYPEAKWEQIRRAYMPGGKAFIDCNLAAQSQQVVFDRYYARGKSDPRWRDLKIRSQELVAIREAANIKAHAELMATARGRRQNETGSYWSPAKIKAFATNYFETEANPSIKDFENKIRAGGLKGNRQGVRDAYAKAYEEKFGDTPTRGRRPLH